ERKMRTQFYLLSLLLVLLLVSNCSKEMTRVNREPLVPLLIQNGDFEKEGEWQISAPLNYSSYGEILIDDQMSHAGKKSGLIYLERIPHHANENVIHAWMQNIHDPPKGVPIVFGGWVSAWQGTLVRIAIEYEIASPQNGQSLFVRTIEFEVKDEHFTFLHDRLVLPQNTIRACFLAGIASTGEAHFDNLFAFVVPIKDRKEKITRKE
ncbi:MAG: hypothetical protein DWQ10_15890, partial [Calditrichaeota bacterium]